MNAAIKQSVSLASLPPEPYEPFPVHCLPPTIQRYVVEASASIGCDPAYVALPMLSALASAIGATRLIRLKAGWLEPSILWTAVIGESGTHKTPAQKAALHGIRAVESARLTEYQEAIELYAQDLAEHEGAMRQWGKVKHGPPPTEPSPPSLKRCLCGDVTVEALAVLLEQNPRGLLLGRDELSGWMGSMNAYKAGSGDDSYWLALHSGYPTTIDRKTGDKKSIHVPRTALSITGGIQPGVFRDAFGRAKVESGMLARFLLAYPDKKPKRWNDRELADEDQEAVCRIIERLCDLSVGVDGEPVVVTLSGAAKEAYTRFYNELGAEQGELSGALASAYSKLEACAPRLALVFHEASLAEIDSRVDDPGVVDAQSMMAAIELTRWFCRETKRIYAILQGSETDMTWHKLAEFIRRRGGEVSTRDLHRGPYRGEVAEAIPGMLGPFVDRGWLEVITVAPTSKGGRPSTAYRLAERVTGDKTPADDP